MIRIGAVAGWHPVGKYSSAFASAEQLSGVQLGSRTNESRQVGGTHPNQLPARGNRHLYLLPLASMAQDVRYAKSQVKVDWVRGTDFSKCNLCTGNRKSNDSGPETYR